MKKAKPEARYELQRKLTRLQQERANHSRQEHLRKLKIDHRRKEREKVGAGKKPFFLKRRVQKEQALAERYARAHTCLYHCANPHCCVVQVQGTQGQRGS